MRHFKLGPSALFKLFITVAAFALGLVAANLWPRQSACPSAPPVAVAAPARAEVSVRDTARPSAQGGRSVYKPTSEAAQCPR